MSMPLRLLFDENLRGTPWTALARKNEDAGEPLEIARVGDFADLPLGISDDLILIWAERNGYVLVTNDSDTMPRFLSQHLNEGRHSPGMFLVTLPISIPDLVEWLWLIAHDPQADQWYDGIVYIP